MNSHPEVSVLGLASSQPTRSVLWFCMQAGIPMHFVSGAHEGLDNSPGIFEVRDHILEHMGEEVLHKLSPLGKVPAVMVGDFMMSESQAIVAYLADRFGANAFYPKRLEERARLNQYLHLHDQFVRQSTATLRPFMRVSWGAGVQTEQEFEEARQEGRELAHQVAKVVDEVFLQDGHDYLLGMDHVTVADIAAYEEIRQVEWIGITDFSEFARLRQWFAVMEKLPFHDAAHRFCTALGDVSHEPSSMERYIGANLEAHRALEEAGYKVTTLPSYKPAL